MAISTNSNFRAPRLVGYFGAGRYVGCLAGGLGRRLTGGLGRRLAAVSLLALPLLLGPLGPSVAASDFLDKLTAPVAVESGDDSGLRLGPIADGDGGAMTNALVTFKPGDLAGTWHFHVWIHAPYPIWIACPAVKIKATGAIPKGSKCTIYDSDAEQYSSGVVGGGKLKVTKAGKITGRLIIGTGQLPVRDGWMDKKKSYLETVGAFVGFATEMSAVKR